MSDNRGPARSDDWLDAATAERLLRGATDLDTADTRADMRADMRTADRTAVLAGLLAAASAPAALDPVREEAAVAAFRSARDEGTLAAGVRHRSRADDWRRPRGLRHVARSAKAVTGALFATAALGGVAVAAAVGALPTSFGGGAPGPAPVHSGGSAHRSGSAAPGGSASSAPDRERPAGGASRGVASGTPSSPAGTTDYQALCRAYQDGKGFEKLRSVAGGGRHQVRRYCAGLLGGGGSGDSQNTGQDGNDANNQQDSTSDKSQHDGGASDNSGNDQPNGPDQNAN
ncbi:hypothetical protein ACFXJ5_01650 [Streptomyces sp. NPDC059373]